MALGQPAAAHERTLSSERALRLVCFHLHDQEFALPIEAVRETIRVRPITKVFLTPAWLIGIFSLRGDIVPAIDIAPWLGMPRTTLGDESRLVVLRSGDTIIGVLADALAELRTLEVTSITEAPRTLSAEQGSLLSGVAATATGTVRLIDPEALLRSERLRELEVLATS